MELIKSIIMKCTKCNREIDKSEGSYNYPSGVQCVDCGNARQSQMTQKDFENEILHHYYRSN
jgi:peptide subunit release factor 1 (eRF1)